MTKNGVVDWLVSVYLGPQRVKASIKRDHFAVHWLQAGCCKWNHETQILHKFQQFIKWLQKLQPEMKFLVLLRWQEFATRSVAVFCLTCHCSGVAGGGGKYRSVSRLGLLIGNRWMSRLVVLECANCSLHTTVEGALSETITMVSLCTVPRLSLRPAAVQFASGEADVRGRAAVLPPTDLAMRSRSRRDQITLPKWGAVFRKQRPERPPSTR